MISLIGFPCDFNSSYMRGAATAPPLIRDALRCSSSNLWTESGIDLEGKWHDCGDVEIATPDSFLGTIECAVKEELDRGNLPISLGGDHSITFPIIKAFSAKYSQLEILHFDAHPDLYEDFEGNLHSHASPFARIMESRLASRLVQVGIRTMNGHQREQARRFNAEVHEAKDWKDTTKLRFASPVYISFDMDVLDPAFAPGVSHPEPGGLSTRQIISIIQSFEAPAIVGADIVEFNPLRDPTGITATTAAKVFKEIAARMLKADL